MSVTQTVGPRSGWYKSSRSNDGPNCVEVNFDGDRVLVRDSKYLRSGRNDPAKQPVIAVPVGSWAAFLEVVCGGVVATNDVPAINHHENGDVSLSRGHVVLTFTPSEWLAFTGGIADGEFAAA